MANGYSGKEKEEFHFLSNSVSWIQSWLQKLILLNVLSQWYQWDALQIFQEYHPEHNGNDDKSLSSKKWWCVWCIESAPVSYTEKPLWEENENDENLGKYTGDCYSQLISSSTLLNIRLWNVRTPRSCLSFNFSIRIHGSQATVY